MIKIGSILIITIGILTLALRLHGESSRFVWKEESRKLEKEQVQIWRENLNNSAALPVSEKLELLVKGIYKMGSRREIEGADPSVNKLYRDIQEELTAIPGHAKYFGDQVRVAQSNYSLYTGEGQYAYEPLRGWVLTVYLCFMQSPEAVAELGSFLSDEKDLEYEPNPGDPPKDYDMQANCDLALRGLKRSKLRTDLGIKDTWRPHTAHHLDLIEWQSWWEKVKSGKLAFSFEGQNVEYRFKADGSWIEGPLGKTNPKDRATHSVNGEMRSVKHGRTTEVKDDDLDTDTTEKSNRFQWIVGILLIFLGIGVYIFKIRSGSA